MFLPDCDDRNPCTVDRCDVDSGCIHEGKDCDDGNACTVDFCNLFDGTGACDHVPASCVDGDPCTEDTCDPLLGCLWEPVDCPDDGDPCTLARCDPEAGGCTLSPACDDGDPCTVDTCDPGTGACTDSPRICPDDGNPCTAEACAPSTGECTRSPLDEGPCNDQDGCTLDDRCVAGLCTGDPDPACDPPTLDLGSPIGVMTFPVLQPDGCWRGEQQLPGCEGLTGCRVTGVACPGGQGEIQSVELSAEAQLTLLGSAPVSGQWNAAGWCLRASLAPERFGSLAEQLLAPPEATVCRLQGGELVQSVRLARWQPFPFDPETVLEGVPVVARTVDPLTDRKSVV